MVADAPSMFPKVVSRANRDDRQFDERSVYRALVVLDRFARGSELRAGWLMDVIDLMLEKNGLLAAGITSPKSPGEMGRELLLGTLSTDPPSELAG